MTWYMNNKVFDPTEEDIKSFHGFVYCITEIDTGKKYIGKKFFWRSKILPVTKTRKRRKRTLVESDWKKYYGSNETLKERVVEGSETNYKREIIKFVNNFFLKKKIFKLSIWSSEYILMKNIGFKKEFPNNKKIVYSGKLNLKKHDFDINMGFSDIY